MLTQVVAVITVLYADAHECGDVDADAFQFAGTVVGLHLMIGPGKPKICYLIRGVTYPFDLNKKQLILYYNIHVYTY